MRTYEKHDRDEGLPCFVGEPPPKITGVEEGMNQGAIPWLFRTMVRNKITEEMRLPLRPALEERLFEIFVQTYLTTDADLEASVATFQPLFATLGRLCPKDPVTERRHAFNRVPGAGEYADLITSNFLSGGKSGALVALGEAVRAAFQGLWLSETAGAIILIWAHESLEINGKTLSAFEHGVPRLIERLQPLVRGVSEARKRRMTNSQVDAVVSAWFDGDHGEIEFVMSPPPPSPAFVPHQPTKRPAPPLRPFWPDRIEVLLERGPEVEVEVGE